MKKKKYLLLFGLLIPLIFTIGFSSWIIMYSFEFSPQYENSSISKFFEYENVTTYNGEGQLPSPKPGVTISGNIQYDYKLESSNTFITDGSKPVNAGTYDIKITITDSEINGTCQVKFIINRKQIKLSTNTININYGDCDRYWSSMGAHIKNSISFLDKDNNTLSDFSFGNQFVLKGMHNGLYYYGDSDYKVAGLTTTTNIAGSTYVAEVTMFDDIALNYEFASSNRVIIKYKTAIISGTYYTIEDAIKNQNGTISFAGNSSSATSYVETVFCCLSDAQGNPYTKSAGYYTEDSINYPGQKIFNISSANVLVPYENSTKYFLENDAGSSTSRVYSCLNIPTSIAMVFSSSKQLQIGGVLNTSGYIGYRGVVMNNGTITLESSSILYSYGFLKGTGIVNVKSGATAYDIMRMFDWPGGSAGSSMANKAFPIIAWSAHNISCPTKIFKGATLKGYSSLSVTLIGYKKPEFTIIGASSSAGECLFRPTSSAVSTDYIYKAGSSANNSLNTSITESNQAMGQKDIVKIHGDYEDNALKISVSIYQFSTSTSKAVPLSYMDIIIAENSSLNISTSSYVFLLGTKLEVEENAVLNVSGSAFLAFDRMSGTTKDTAIINPWFGSTYCVNAEDSVLILNGTLNGTGTIAGNIVTEVSGAQSSISKYSISSLTMKKDAANADEVLSAAFYSYGDVGDASSFSYTTFTDATPYISTTLDGEEVIDKNYYFTAATNVKTFTLNFFDSDKSTPLGSKNIQVLLPNDDGNYVYTINGKELVPFKMHYDFSEWYYMSNNAIAGNTTLIYNLTDSSANTYDFYATWVEHEYTISYSAGYEDPDSGEVIPLDLIDITLTDVISSFKLSNFNSSPLQITTKASYLDYYFNGWYLGVDDSTNIKLTELSKENIELFVNTFGTDTPIPLYCRFSSEVYYSIVFVDNQSELDDPVILTNLKPTDIVNLPDTSELDNLSSFNKYCISWHYDNTLSNNSIITSGVTVQTIIDKMVDLDGTTISLYGKWIDKEVVIKYYDFDKNIINDYTQYVIKNKNVMLQKEMLKSSTEGSETSGYTTNYEFINWKTSDNSVSYTAESIVSLGNSINLYANLLVTYSYKLTLDIDNATITINGTPYTSDTVLTFNVSTLTKVSINYSATGNNTDYLKVEVDGSEKYKGDNKTYNGTIDMTKNTKIYAIGTDDRNVCLAEGTLITLADGSKKKIEELNNEDLLLVFNHETGKLDIAPVAFVIHKNSDKSWQNVLNLKFADGTKLRIVGEHGLFDCTLNKYVYINQDNAHEYIGNYYYSESGKLVELIEYDISKEYISFYSPISSYHLNCFAEGLLTITNFSEPATNIFQYNDNLQYDLNQIYEEINLYGLFSYDDFKEYTTYEIYAAFPAAYFKIAIAKGHTTFEQILFVLYTFLQ